MPVYAAFDRFTHQTPEAMGPKPASWAPPPSTSQGQYAGSHMLTAPSGHSGSALAAYPSPERNVRTASRARGREVEVEVVDLPGFERQQSATQTSVTYMYQSSQAGPARHVGAGVPESQTLSSQTGSFNAPIGQMALPRFMSGCRSLSPSRIDGAMSPSQIHRGPGQATPRVTSRVSSDAAGSGFHFNPGRYGCDVATRVDVVGDFRQSPQVAHELTVTDDVLQSCLRRTDHDDPDVVCSTTTTLPHGLKVGQTKCQPSSSSSSEPTSSFPLTTDDDPPPRLDSCESSRTDLQTPFATNRDLQDPAELAPMHQQRDFEVEETQPNEQATALLDCLDGDSRLAAENAQLRENANLMQIVKRRMGEQISCLKHQVSSLEEELRHYKAMHFCSESSIPCRTNSEDLELMSLRQQLSAVQLVKDALNKENLELQQRFYSTREEGPQINKHTCVICMDNLVNVICLPCRHLALCTSCSQQRNVDSCPICRCSIGELMQVFLA